VGELQPSLREALAEVAGIEHLLTSAKEVRSTSWCIDRPSYGRERVLADGFCMRHHRARGWFDVRWPMSDISARCDDCGGVLRASRDCGAQGFYYDRRWLTGNPAVRDPRSHAPYQPRYACLPCYNRVRPKLARAEQINEIRLMIGRIKREACRAA
jgi:hypothetical protein